MNNNNNEIIIVKLYTLYISAQIIIILLDIL